MSCCKMFSVHRVLVLLAVAAAFHAGLAAAQVFDDFSDLNDTANPAWTRLSGYVNSTGQAWDASTGQYRFTAPNNGANARFIGSHAGPSFTDVTVSSDVVSFTGSPAGAVFGVAARLNGLNGVGQLTGYAYAYEPFASAGAGEMVLYRINPAVSITDIGSQQVTLDANKDYKFVLDIQGTQLAGRVFEIGGGMVAENLRTDVPTPADSRDSLHTVRIQCRPWTSPSTTSAPRFRSRRPALFSQPGQCCSLFGAATLVIRR